MNAVLHKNMPIEEYHAHKDVLSASMISEFMDCPARFKYRFIDGNDQQEKSAFRIGTAVHTLALEPELFHDQFYIIPHGIRRDKRTDEFKKCIAEAGQRKMLLEKGNDSETGYDHIKSMAASLKKDRRAIELLEGPMIVEASIFWTCPVTGIKLRCRPDVMNELAGRLTNVKTARSVHPRDFERDAYDHNYDIQVAITAEGFHAYYGKMPTSYNFLGIEKKPPHLIEAYDAFQPFFDDLTYLHVGQKRLKAALERYKICKENNYWPGYSDKIEPMGAPNWVIDNMQEEIKAA